MGDVFPQGWIGALLVMVMLAMHLSRHLAHRDRGRRGRGGCGSRAGHGVGRPRERDAVGPADSSPVPQRDALGLPHAPHDPSD